MSPHRREYLRRVNRAIDQIERHLAEDLPLERLAAVAAFSPFHFHRVFKAVTGETLFDFVRRRRIEKGAQALLVAPRRRVGDIAIHCGFASAATFARAFRTHFRMTASAWRSGGYARWRKSHKDRKASKTPVQREGDTFAVGAPRVPRVRIAKLPSYRVAYMRYVGPYGAAGIPSLWRTFISWADRARLRSEDTLLLGMIYDNPNIAAARTCRYDASVVVPWKFAGDRQVNIAATAPGTYGMYSFAGTASEIADAWQRTFIAWLPDSGYEPDDKPCLELYRAASPIDGRSGVFSCDLCLPVRRLHR